MQLCFHREKKKKKDFKKKDFKKKKKRPIHPVAALQKEHIYIFGGEMNVSNVKLIFSFFNLIPFFMSASLHFLN